MIAALVLAAGQSLRMGQAKMTLPWGQTTVIGKVVGTLLEGGISDLLIVTGGNQAALKKTLGLYPIEFVFNPDFANGEMISSVQVGLRHLYGRSEAALISLGDQPQIENSVVKAVIEEYLSHKSKIVVPSYQMRRGHPWLIARSLWDEILALNPANTLRDYLNSHQDFISYVSLDTPSILQDLDTPDDYKQFNP